MIDLFQPVYCPIPELAGARKVLGMDANANDPEDKLPNLREWRQKKPPKTHCNYGHALETKPNGKRRCKICQRESDKRRRAKK